MVPISQGTMGYLERQRAFCVHAQLLDSRERADSSLPGSASKQEACQYGWAKGQDTN